MHMDSFYIYMNEDATKDMFNVKFDCYHYGASKIDARPAKLTNCCNRRTDKVSVEFTSRSKSHWPKT